MRIAAMAAKVFLSYRREDSAAYTGRVQDRLAREFGSDLLFMDVDNIPLGVDFGIVLRDAVAECEVLLAVIGPNWLDARDEAGSRRLDDPNDFVRIEIGAALQRSIRVIPILIDGAKVPKASQLPEDLKELAMRNALDVRHSSFHSDLDKLVRDLTSQWGESAKPQPEAENARFEFDVFISYAHMDNRCWDGQQGWITQFHARLEAFLRGHMGRKVSIWRDKGDGVSSVAPLGQSAVFVCIVTGNYLRSPRCVREARDFCERAQQRGTLVIKNKLSVFKVIMDPWIEDQVDAKELLPAAIMDIIGYHFFSLNRQLSFSNQEDSTRLNQLIAKLAWEMANLLKIMT
jgi:hypothetical protein